MAGVHLNAAEPKPPAAKASAAAPGLKKGRVLRATFGCNPNSSSLGVDVTFLLFGATFASALALGLGALLRRSPAPAVEAPREPPPEPAP
jgi:hypothetical protein